MSYYQILGVDQQVTSDQLAEAYERQRQRYDPERVPAEDQELRSVARERTAEIEQAYAVLSDPARRSDYDAQVGVRPVGPVASPRQQVTRREIGMAVAGALVGLAVIAAVWFFAARSADPALPAVGETNRAAPEFALPALDGGTVRLSDYRGKVVLVNFWGTWCEPCKEETPALQAVYSDLAPQGLEIIGVNLYNQETQGREAVRAFLEPYGVAYPVALDTSGDTARAFQISPIPVSYFVDPQGTIRYVKVGVVTAADVRVLFERLRSDQAAGHAQP